MASVSPRKSWPISEGWGISRGEVIGIYLFVRAAFNTRSPGNPIEQEKGTGKEWKNAVKCVAGRMGMTINRQEHLCAKCQRRQRDERSGDRNGQINPDDALKPHIF